MTKKLWKLNYVVDFVHFDVSGLSPWKIQWYNFKRMFRGQAILRVCENKIEESLFLFFFIISNFHLHMFGGSLVHHKRKFSPQVCATPHIGLTPQPLKIESPDSGGHVKFTTKYITVEVKGGVRHLMGAILLFWLLGDASKISEP